MPKKKKSESTPAKEATTEQVTPEATPEGAEAAPAVEPGTTEQLFNDLMPPAAEETPPSEGASTEEAPPVEPTETPAATKEEEAPPGSGTPALPEYLSLEEFGDVKVRTKVDGVEVEKTFKEVVKGYQTDSHLTQKGQKLAQSIKEFEEIKAKAAQMPAAPLAEDDYYMGEDETVKKAIAPLEAELAKLQAQIAQASPAIGEVQYQHDLKIIDAELKELGFTDFMEYLPRIEEYVFSLPVREQAEVSTFEFYRDRYKTLKLKDALNPSASAASKETASSVDNRPVPPVAPIESGGGTPSGVDSDQAAYDKAFDRAKKTGDFSEVLRLKGL